MQPARVTRVSPSLLLLIVVSHPYILSVFRANQDHSQGDASQIWNGNLRGVGLARYCQILSDPVIYCVKLCKATSETLSLSAILSAPSSTSSDRDVPKFCGLEKYYDLQFSVYFVPLFHHLHTTSYRHVQFRTTISPSHCANRLETSHNNIKYPPGTVLEVVVSVQN